MRVKHVPRSFRSYLREHCLGCPHHGYRACRTVFSATLPGRRYSKAGAAVRTHDKQVLAG